MQKARRIALNRKSERNGVEKVPLDSLTCRRSGEYAVVQEVCVRVVVVRTHIVFVGVCMFGAQVRVVCETLIVPPIFLLLANIRAFVVKTF